MKNDICLLLSLLFVTSFYSQTKDEISTLKKYSLQKCLKNNYYLEDSSFVSHDYSASYMLQIKNADYTMLNKLDEYTEKNTSHYYKMETAENLEDSKANYIFWNCMEFYESKELDRFIKKILGMGNKKEKSKTKN